MDGPSDHVVQVWSTTGGFLGSGFFVAKRIVVTCAHVLEKAGDEVRIRWSGRELAGAVLVRDPPSRAGGRYYPAPDVAFIGVETLDNPEPSLITTPLGRDVETVFVEGFSTVNPTGTVALERRDVRLIGESGKYVLLDDNHIVPGMSGAPVVEREGSEAIRGMLKSGKLSQGNTAYVVPMSEIAQSHRRHKPLLSAQMPDLPSLVRPRPGDPLHDLLSAQREAAKRYPYRVATLTQREPPPLSSVYVEQRTSPIDRDPRRRTPISPLKMLRLHRNALIVGGPGGGKSTLIQHMVAVSAGWWLSEGRPGPDETPELGRVVAVRVAAQDLLAGNAWYEALAEAVNTDLSGLLDLPMTAAAFVRPPAPGAEWLILVDGLDEVRAARHRLIERLRARVNRYGATTRFVVTSRPLADREFGMLRASLAVQSSDRLGEYDLRPFDWPAVQTFAHNWFRPAGGQQSPVEPADYLTAIRSAGLAPLVEVPLLATISAIVYEEKPESPLPLDRAGLYEKFVFVLLTLREQSRGARADLLDQLAPLGRQAEEIGEQMFDERMECLSFVAEQALSHGRRIDEALRDWLAGQFRRLPVGVTAEHLRGLLLDTGLVAAYGEDLVFIHQSFAEYLASLRLAASFDPEAWLVQVRHTGPDSLGLFTLAAWGRMPGHDPQPVVRALIGSGQRGEFPHLADVAALIQDGGVVAATGGAEIIDMAETTVRRVRKRDDSVAPAINQALRAILQRTRDTARMVRLIVDRRLPIVKRAEAARVLITSETVTDHKIGLDELLRLAYEERLSEVERIWALHVIVESGPSHERRFAVQHLTQCVETTPHDDVRMHALDLLARSGEGAAGAAALMRRSLDFRWSLDQRTQASYMLAFHLDTSAPAMRRTPDDLGDIELDSRTWRPVGTPGDDPDTAADYAAMLQRLVRRLSRPDLGRLRLFLERYVRTRALAWDERVQTIMLSGGEAMDRTAWEAIVVLAGDAQEPPRRRVALLVRAERRVPAWSGLVREMLARWVRDERQGRAMRREALHELVTRMDPPALLEFAEDAGLPVYLRSTAAVEVGYRPQTNADARRLLTAMARDRRNRVADRLACRIRLALLPRFVEV